jgi:hypothetical protein
VGLFDGHDLQNPDKVFIIIYLEENREYPGDMDTVYPIIIREDEEFAIPGSGVFPRFPQGTTGIFLQLFGKIFQKIDGLLVNFDPVHG